MSTRPTLTPEQLDAFGREMDVVRTAVLEERGERDLAHIRSVIALQRRLDVGGRALLAVSILPPAWIAGTAALSVAKILDNMEIGHNVMHGQYDWTGDPALSSRRFEWDTVSPAEHWRHSHNVRHHRDTNIVGKDRDVGYGILRMSEAQGWNPYYLGNPVYAALLCLFFEYGVMLHELEVEEIAAGRRGWQETKPLLGQMGRKAGSQALKDYVVFPLLTGPSMPFALAGTVTANLVRNVWAFTIIFCGHFPDGVEQFTEEETADETRPQWYLRQLLGSANLTGGKLFHLMTGHLSFQVEHHLFPDLPAHRYPEIAEHVRDACERYGLPYNTGGLTRQFGTVVRRIARLALPQHLPTRLPLRRRGPRAAGDDRAILDVSEGQAPTERREPALVS